MVKMVDKTKWRTSVGKVDTWDVNVAWLIPLTSRGCGNAGSS
jgi:hypothetical protein